MHDMPPSLEVIQKPIKKNWLKFSLFGLLAVLAVVVIFVLIREPYSANAMRGATENNQRKTNGENAHHGARMSARVDDLHKKSLDVAIGITPEIARQRALDAERITDIFKRAMLHRQIIVDLCRAGYTNEAWEMIGDSPGKVRDFELRAFFYEAKIDQHTITSKIFGLAQDGYVGDQSSALSAYMERLSAAEVGKFVESGDFKAIASEMSDRSSLAFKNTMEAYFLTSLADGKASETNMVIDAAKEFLGKGLLGEDDFVNIIRHANALNSLDKWRMLTGVITKSTPDSQGDRRKLVQEMVRENAPEALDLIVGYRGDETGADLIEGLQQWSYQEPEAVAKWFKANQPLLSPKQRDAAATAFCEAALTFKERESAMQWADQIQDSETRERLHARISSTFPEK